MRKKKASKDISAIRFHLDGTVEVSRDHGKTWGPFDGIVINAALIEYAAEIKYMKAGNA